MTVQEILQAMERLLQPVVGEIREIKEDVREVKADVQTLKEDVQTLKAETQEVKVDVQTLKEDAQTLNDRVAGLKLHLENITDRGIKIISEGHADLTRKLDDALKVENEKELLLLRMNYLEGELEFVKKRLAALEKKSA